MLHAFNNCVESQRQWETWRNLERKWKHMPDNTTSFSLTDCAQICLQDDGFCHAFRLLTPQTCTTATVRRFI